MERWFSVVFLRWFSGVGKGKDKRGSRWEDRNGEGNVVQKKRGEGLTWWRWMVRWRTTGAHTLLVRR
jgi:hypothetical protein